MTSPAPPGKEIGRPVTSSPKELNNDVGHSHVQAGAVKEICTLHAEIFQAARKTIAKAIRIGELLTITKAGLKHGEWLPWVKENLPFSQTTASNYMRVFCGREKLATVANLTGAYRMLNEPTKVLPKVDTSSSEEITPDGFWRFVDAAWALREIRDKKLYREKHSSIYDFCFKQFGIEPTLVDLAMEVTEFEFVRAARKAAA